MTSTCPCWPGPRLTNELVVRDIVDRILHDGPGTVALFGLSFKADTDDLRESPNVELAERLIGKGFNVRIYDPIVNPDRLRGSNLRQVEARLPHLTGCSPHHRRRLCRAPTSLSCPWQTVLC